MSQKKLFKPSEQLKPSGCVNPYHPPECERKDPECMRDLTGHVVLTEVEYKILNDARNPLTVDPVSVTKIERLEAELRTVYNNSQRLDAEVKVVYNRLQKSHQAMIELREALKLVLRYIDSPEAQSERTLAAIHGQECSPQVANRNHAIISMARRVAADEDLP